MEYTFYKMNVRSFFFIFCLGSWFSQLQAPIISEMKTPDSVARLKVISIENETDALEFQIFYAEEGQYAFVFPKSTFVAPKGKELKLMGDELLAVKCCKGSFLPVFIQDGFGASGTVEEGFEGPYYISMWMQFPQVPEAFKVHVRYMIKKGTIGSIGIKIGQKGDYRLVAHENVKFIL